MMQSHNTDTPDVIHSEIAAPFPGSTDFRKLKKKPQTQQQPNPKTPRTPPSPSTVLKKHVWKCKHSESPAQDALSSSHPSSGLTLTDALAGSRSPTAL